MKIRIRLIIVMAVLLIVTATVFGIFLGAQLDSTADSIFETYLSEISRAQAQTLSDYIADASDRFDYISKLPAVKTFTSGNYSAGSKEYNAAEETFNALVGSKSIEAIVVFDASNNILLQAGSDANITTAAGICNTEADDGVLAVNISENEKNKTDYSISIKNTVSNGRYLGVVFSKDYIARVIDRAKGLIFIADPKGSIITAQNYVGNILSGNVSTQYTPYKQLIASASSTPTGYKVADGATLAYVTASDAGWTVVSNQEVIKAMSFSNSAAGTVTGVSVAMIVIFLVAGIIMIVMITKPFYKIDETLQKIAHGDHEARVDIMSKNEYGDIARVFNDIVDNIIVSESRYRTIIEMSDNIIFEWNLQSNEVTFSNNFNKKFSYRAPSDHFADSFLLKCKIHPEDSDKYKADLERLAKGENFKHNEYRVKNIYGDYIWVLMRTASIVDKDGQAVKIVGVIVDIDRAKKSENILTARASFDSLTGVYNRETIENAINNEIEFIAARKNEFAILFVDIDDFKFFNDQYSHATGDQVLRFTATTIKNAVGENGLVGRYGGDEFIVCIKDADTNDPTPIAEAILNTLKEGFESDSGDRLSVNVSIGIAKIKDNTRRVDEIIGMADDAMYKIKKNGKSNFGYLDDDMNF